MNYKAGKNMFKLIAFSNIIFVLLFGTVSYFNRIAADDFYSIAFLKEHGILNGVAVFYSAWSGRWASSFINLCIIDFYSFKFFLFVFGLLILMFFIFSVKRLIQSFNEIIGWGNLNFWKELHLAIFIVSALFYATIKIDETWFWLCSSCIYLVSMIFFFLGASALISARKSISNILLIIISYTFIGGSCEPLALLTLWLLIIYLLAILLGSQSIIVPKKEQFIRCGLAFLCCLISFIFSYIAEGNRIRESFFGEISLWGSLFLNIKITGMIIFLRLPFILPFVILFGFPAYQLGNSMSTKSIDAKILLFKILSILFLYVALIYIYQLPITFITKDIGAFRALFPVTLISLLAGFCIFYNLGLARAIKTSKINFIVMTTLILICCLNTYTLISQLIVLPKYAQSYDQRIQYLNKNKKNPQTIIVAPLPVSGLLYSAEITTNSAHFTNQHLKKGLALKSDVVVSNN